MLGIRQIEQRIAELIRGAMPFAIINNGTNPDGSARPISWFARLISYPTLKAAIDAGLDNGVKWIKIAQGYYNEPAAIVISGNGFLIEGSGWGTTIIYVVNGTYGLEITGDFNIIRNFEIKSHNGTFRPFYLSGDDNRAEYIYGSTSFGAFGGNRNIMAFCYFPTAGAQDFVVGGTNGMAIGCITGPNSANENLNLAGTGCGVFSCIFDNGGARSLRISGGAVDSIIDGVLHDQGGTLNSGTGCQIVDTEQF